MNLFSMRILLRTLTVLSLTLLVACGSLPTIVPDMAYTNPASVKIDSTHGPLSAERSKAVIDRLKANGVQTNIFDLHMAIEEAIVGSPLTDGNKVELDRKSVV